MQLPGDKEGGPVDIRHDLGEVIAVECLGAGKSGFYRGKGIPVERHFILLCLGEAQVLLGRLLIGEIILEPGIFVTDGTERPGLSLLAQQGADDGNAAGCVQDMNHALVELRGDLYGRMYVNDAATT